LAQPVPPDEHKGLGVFTFGADLSQWEEQLEGTLQISYGQKYFDYQGDSMKTMYGLKVRTVNVGFLHEKLNYIDIYFKGLDEEGFMALLKMVEQDFGPAEVFEDPSEPGVLNSYRWKGAKKSFQLLRYGKGAIDWDDRDMTILMAQAAPN